MTLTLSLAESLKLTNDTLQAGVIEILGQESKVLSALPFMNIQGSGYTYTVQKAIPETKFRTVGEAYTPTETTLEQRTESLMILGDEAIVDTFQAQVYSDINDLMAIEVALKTKALAYAYEKTFVTGDTSKNAKAFNGLAKRVDKKQTLEGTGKLATDIDAGIDAIKGTPNALIMSKSVRRKFVSDYRNYITWNRNEFGVKLASYGEIPILDLEDEVMGAEKDSVYVVRFGVKDGVCGLQNGGINVTPLGQMESAPQLKTRIEWFTGLAVFDDKSVAKIKVKEEVKEEVK